MYKGLELKLNLGINICNSDCESFDNNLKSIELYRMRDQGLSRLKCFNCMIDGFNIKVLVTTLTSQGSGPWGCDSSDITGAVSTTDGLSNTNSMMTANCNIQKICRNMGATWYLPAQNELDTIYSNKPALGLVTTNLNQYGDGAWSSTQLNSGSAYYHSQWAYGWVYTYKTLNYGAFLYE